MRQTSSAEVKSVGIWIRVSTDDQVRGESPEHHEERARAYALIKGWHVAEVYRLDAVSGKAVMGHPTAKRMLADVRAGTITGLVFSKLARLARNTRELLDFAEIFRACDADMISLAESIDTSTPAGRLFFTMIAAMAQWEREEIADRVKASIPVRAKLGKPIGGPGPFGYCWVDKKLEVDPERAPVRLLAYELFAEHQRKRTVARTLNDRGYRTRKGELFSANTVRRMIECPSAKGMYRANYTASSNSSHSALKPEEEWVLHEVAPIVSEELWERCNAILAGQLIRKPAKRAAHLFSGYAFCDCGPKMYVVERSSKYVCQACRNKIPEDTLEAVFRSELSDFLLSPDELDAHHAAGAEMLREKEALIDACEGELKKLQTAEAELFELYHAGQLAKGDFGRHHKPLSSRRREVEEELPRLEAERDVLKIGMLSRDEVLEGAQDMATRWSDLPFAQRRQIVESITDRIVIGKEGVEISLLHLPFGSDGERDAGPPTSRPLRSAVARRAGQGRRAERSGASLDAAEHGGSPLRQSAPCPPSSPVRRKRGGRRVRAASRRAPLRCAVRP